MQIEILALGAGQDVGRSCLLLSIKGKRIMLDCGMHPGFDDERRFPDFSLISKSGNFSDALDCIIISHFHLDHCGALPYFTEVCGFNGPIYMTHPTKAVCPILLEDYRKVTMDRRASENIKFFNQKQIKDCMKKVIAVNIHQTVQVDDELEIKPYYAGHVLGAAMFYIKVGEQSVVYTGDYNMTPDRHLGAASIDKVRPDVLITETTYATTIRDSKRKREHDFLKQVHDCVDKGGKVLIPVFALGRAQELCILIDTYWERVGLNVPIYFSAGLTEKANHYYKLFINWTNQKIKNTFVHRNMFEFKHIRPFDRDSVDLDAPGGMVLFATPGMLHAGFSLDVFKRWAPCDLNMVIIPGYCVVGTVGNKLTSGKTGPVEIDKRTTVDVKCRIRNLSFSAHADAKGIMQLIRQVEPSNVLLVHGEKGKMQFLKQRILREFGIPCFDPPNGSSVSIDTDSSVPCLVSKKLLKRPLPLEQLPANPDGRPEQALKRANAIRPVVTTPVEGLIFMNQNQTPQLLSREEAADELNLPLHTIRFSSQLPITSSTPDGNAPAQDGADKPPPPDSHELLDLLYTTLTYNMEYDGFVCRDEDRISLRSIVVSLPPNSDKLTVQWSQEDDEFAGAVLMILQTALREMHQSAFAESSEMALDCD